MIFDFTIFFSKIKSFLPFLLIHYFLFFPDNGSARLKDHNHINILVDKCILDSSNCKESFLRIHSYQVEAASAKNFPCQTRLLGLEANLIMAMNNNLKEKKLYNATNAVKKYC